MTDIAQTLARASRQQQFLDVIDLAEAKARLRAHFDPRPRGTETVALGEALNRVLAADDDLLRRPGHQSGSAGSDRENY